MSSLVLSSTGPEVRFEQLTFDGRSVQGGLVGTLADYAAVSAAISALPEGWAALHPGAPAAR